MGKSDPIVTIVVPVYGDWTSLADCISSLKQHLKPPHTVLFVNDCGPEVDVMEKNILSAISKNTDFRYERNPNNLGFVGTCNRAVSELDKTTNDIILLNSDTKVTEGFIEKLLEVLYADDMNAAVSPRSNNATICTLPLSAASKKGIEPEKSYYLFQKIKEKLPVSSIAPVAHGFCMLIRRSVILKYGLFDPIFGKGYGEEVDFCQRIAKDGYHSLIANRAYVFHMEARSFTLETKAKLLEVNNKIIWEKYPNYREDVRCYMLGTMHKEDSVIAQIYGYGIVNKIKMFKRKLLS